MIRIRAVLAALALGTSIVPGGADPSPGRPFSPASAWNAPVAPDARYEPVPGLAGLPAGVSSGLWRDGVSVPVLAAAPGDPAARVLRNPQAWSRLYAGAWRTSGNPPAIEAEIRRGSTPSFPLDHHPFASQSATAFVVGPGVRPIERLPDGSAPRVRMPAGARGSGNGDSHMVVLQPDGTAFESYATIVLSDRTVVCLTYQITRPHGDGEGSEDGVTASLIPVYAGLLRKAEAESGRVDHALKVVVPAGILATSYVPPARAFDRGALTETPPYSGTLPMGARLALPRDTDLDALGLETREGRMLAEAARTYGAIVTDRGGAGVTVVVEAGALPSPGGGVARDMRRIVGALMRVAPPVRPRDGAG